MGPQLGSWGHGGEPVPVPSVWGCPVVSGAPWIIDTSPVSASVFAWHLPVCLGQVAPFSKDQAYWFGGRTDDLTYVMDFSPVTA